MRVCILHTDFRIYWPARLRALQSYLKDRGHELHIVEISGSGSPYAFAGRSSDGIANWHCLFPEKAMEAISARSASAAVVKKLNALQPDVVMAGAIAYSSGASAVAWARNRGCPVVIFDNSRLVDVPRNRFVNWVKKRINSNVGAMFLPAPSHADDYAFWGIPREKMFFGLNAVDNGYFALEPEKRRSEADLWKENLRLPKRYLLGVGRQVEKKNWIGLLRAWEEVRTAIQAAELSLVMVGDGPERKRLEHYTRDHRLKNVYFHDFVSQQDISAYYAMADALVLPSHTGETWGLVVNEAMASGLPVLVSRECGCARTLVEEGRNGWTFRADNRQELAAALLNLAGTTEAHLEKMGQRSREIIDDWGLERFCEGAWGAIQCALQASPQKAGFVDTCILSLWKGRYRPT